MMWAEFKVLQQQLEKARGSTVEDAMRVATTVGAETSLQEAADIIVQKVPRRA